MGGKYVCKEHGPLGKMACVSASLGPLILQGSLAGASVHPIRTLSPDRAEAHRVSSAYLDAQDFERVVAYLKSNDRAELCLVDRARSAKALNDRLFMQKMKRSFRLACPACLAQALEKNS
ncbi:MULTISPECIES: hypothetical protein [unclassified Dyella]|uniref:hypothetical protein n=1 Tax=unclassified Dyella TaxID=2634549 RepID=UPI000C82DA9F|nr:MULTISPECIES: hypothetical protein [unclassified Dyella]MDR3445032.1 hypothetical protein [Dyella sp.]